MSRSGREALPDIREWAGVTPESPGVVVRPSRMYGSDPESLLNVWG